MKLPCLRSGWGVLGLVLIAAVGCGGEAADDRVREEVSGTVTLDGKPLDEGMIQFFPLDLEKGTEISAVIKDGTFQIPKIQGPVAGTYRVAISSGGGAVEDPGVDAMPGESVPVPKQSIPPEYNSKTKLTKEVKSGQPNTFDFVLKR